MLNCNHKKNKSIGSTKKTKKTKHIFQFFCSELPYAESFSVATGQWNQFNNSDKKTWQHTCITETLKLTSYLWYAGKVANLRKIISNHWRSNTYTLQSPIHPVLEGSVAKAGNF